MPSDLRERLVALARQPSKPETIVVTTSEATTPVFNFSRGSMMAIRRTAGSVTTLTPYASDTESGTYTEVSNLDDPITIDGDWFVVDEKMFPFEFVKFVGDAAGTIQVIQKG